MNRVVVTGATGFVGRHLVEALLDRADVVVAVRDHSRLPTFGRSVTVLPFDLDRPALLTADELRGADCVYHLAARVHVMGEGAKDEDRFRHENARATEILAATSAAAGVRRLVYLSSIKVNGERTLDRAFSATDPPTPEDSYGRSKLEAERCLVRLAKNTGLEIVIVRPPLVYGPGVGANFRRLIWLVNTGCPLPFGAVRNRRSLISVWNLVDLLMRVGRSTSAPGRVWLASDDHDVSTPGLLDLIAMGLGRTKTRLVPVPVRALRALGAMTGRRGQIARLVDSLQVDVSATRAGLGWGPPVSVEEGISRTVGWFRRGGRATS